MKMSNLIVMLNFRIYGTIGSTTSWNCLGFSWFSSSLLSPRIKIFVVTDIYQTILRKYQRNVNVNFDTKY